MLKRAMPPFLPPRTIALNVQLTDNTELHLVSRRISEVKQEKLADPSDAFHRREHGEARVAKSFSSNDLGCYNAVINPRRAVSVPCSMVVIGSESVNK